MKFSIITPTHNTKHLKELEYSILSQIYNDWEWIILLNNGATYKSLDSRVKIFTCPFESTSVGALKKYACSLATGEIIVEVDHDDMLTPDCLKELTKPYKDNEIGFVYSRDAMLGEFTPYSTYYGWTYDTFDWQGKLLYAMHNQPLYPGRLGQIYFAPDHVRSWRKSIYDEIGGHNEELKICDDLDLMHRLYMVTKFYFINKVLYIYRIDGNNTWLKNIEDIGAKNGELYMKNIINLCTRFCEINDVLKIDLCGGFNKPEGFMSIDKENGDIYADLDEGIPLPDNSVGVVRAFDALEHVKDKEKIMAEIHRVLIPGGMLISQTPSTDGRGAWQDPTHVSFWNENAFWYWTKKEFMQYIRNDKVKFRESYLTSAFLSDWHRTYNIPYVIFHGEKE
jgi:glycosyltransferase involved in cell wall biosynthesis